MSWRCLEEIFSRRLGKTSWRYLEDAFKTYSKRLQDVLKMPWRSFWKTPWRHLEESWRRLGNVWKTSWRRLERVWPRWIYWSLSRRLRTFWGRITKANIFVLIKTSWRRLEEIFWRQRQKTSSRRMFSGLDFEMWYSFSQYLHVMDKNIPCLKLINFLFNFEGWVNINFNTWTNTRRGI